MQNYKQNKMIILQLVISYSQHHKNNNNYNFHLNVQHINLLKINMIIQDTWLKHILVTILIYYKQYNKKMKRKVKRYRNKYN